MKTLCLFVWFASCGGFDATALPHKFCAFAVWRAFWAGLGACPPKKCAQKKECAIHHPASSSFSGAPSLQRARGNAFVAGKCEGERQGIADLRMSGCMKVLFARNPVRTDAIVINTAGGVTGGDHLELAVECGPRAQMSVTTQAAERAYRSAGGTAKVDTHLNIDAQGALFWLPQELILFDGAALGRSLTCDMAPDAQFLMVEPVVFGRKLMGEALESLSFTDRIRVQRAGRPLFWDSTALGGDLAALDGPAAGAGSGAMATLLYVAPDAAARLPFVQSHLPTLGGASLLDVDVLLVRLLAADGFALRKALLPMLDTLTQNTLPPSWRL